MTTIPPVVPPLPVRSRFALDLPANAGFDWLAAGWRDLWTEPGPSLAYGLLVLVLSAAVVVGLSWSGLSSILFPALAGFLVFAPALATGLYEKSRALEAGEPVSFRRMIFPRPASGGQILFTGALLCGLMLLWMRAAIIIYALFFGVNPFPAGLDPVLNMLVTTRQGAGMLLIGSVVGALFAAFSLAISAFSIPMMYDRQVDALTAMGNSWALVWNNRRAMIVWGAIVLALFLLSLAISAFSIPMMYDREIDALTAMGHSWALVLNNLKAMIVWGAIVLVLFVLSLATALVGLVVVFPLLGHATWHAYKATRPSSP